MRNEKITALVILIVIAIGWYLFFHLPGQDRLDKAYDDLKSANQKLINYQQALKYFASGAKKHNPDYFDTINKKHPFANSDEVVALYESLDSLCNQPEFKLEEITPSLEEMIEYQRQRQKGNSAAPVPIRLKLDGRYEMLGELIGKIENHPHFDHWLTAQIMGSKTLYPGCKLQIAFVARLDYFMEVAGIE